MLYIFFSFVINGYHIFSCPTTHILSTQHFVTQLVWTYQQESRYPWLWLSQQSTQMWSVMIGTKKNTVWSVRWSLHCFELPTSPWFSSANSHRNGNTICSDVSQIQLDSSVISWLTVMTSLTCCISIVVSPPYGSSSFPAYRGSALVKTIAVQSFIFCLYLLFTPVTLNTPKTRILN